MKNQTNNQQQMSSEMFAIAYDYKMDTALMQPSVTTPKINKVSSYTVKFVPCNSTNGSDLKELISKKITQYDTMYLRRGIINNVEYTSAYSNGTTIVYHSSLDIIKDVARELRDIHKIDFKLKLVKDNH